MITEKVKPQRLGAFILENIEAILVDWEDYARRYWEGPVPNSKTIRNHAELMLRAVVKDMASSQSSHERKAKSEGESAEESTDINQAALGHALARVHDGFDIERMIAEFRALRASVNRLWWDSMVTPHREQINDMSRFNEALDQLVAGSVTGFTERVDQSRRLFLGMLGHDLRQPLNSLKLFTQVLGEKPGLLPPATAPLVSSMSRCCDSMGALLHDLLDFTTTQLGSAMPVEPVTTHLDEVCDEVLSEVQAGAPKREFTLEKSGDLAGEWDAARLRQVISNLLQNAIQHGAPDQPVAITLRGTDGDITLAVQNMGEPVPEEAISTLFDPMVRLASRDKSRPPGSIGLGLYICREIAKAHHGGIAVKSSANEGTTFTVTLPKRFVPENTEAPQPGS